MIQVTVYRRHSADCAKRDSKDQKRACECKVWLGWNKDGKQTQKSAKTRDWNLAAEQARVIEKTLNDAALGKPAEPNAAKTVEQAVTSFLVKKRNENLAVDSVYRHEQITKSLVDFCNHEGVLFIKDITLDHLNMWQASWPLKAPQARRSRQEKARNFFKYCLANRWIMTNPAIPDLWTSVKVNARDREKNVRAFTDAEYDKVISSIETTSMTAANKARVKALMQLQRWSGLSLVDAVCLSRSELQQEGKGKGVTFRVVTDRQKTGTVINNVIPAWLGQELLTVKNGNPEYFFWSGNNTPENAPSYFQSLYHRVFKAAGVEGSSHDLRHTYAVELLKSGVDIRTVSKALGHSSVTITERFYSRWCVGQQDNLDNTLRAALEG
jgi:site-specific recombinase XerD